MLRISGIPLLAAALLYATAAQAGEHEKLVMEILPEIRQAIVQQDTVDLLHESNAARGTNGIDSTAANSVGTRLREIVNADGSEINEIFVIDASGSNIARSSTSPVFQLGDRARLFDTATIGTDSVKVSDLEFDETTGTILVLAEFAVPDSDSGESIGTVIVVFDAELL